MNNIAGIIGGLRIYYEISELRDLRGEIGEQVYKQVSIWSEVNSVILKNLHSPLHRVINLQIGTTVRVEVQENATRKTSSKINLF